MAGDFIKISTTGKKEEGHAIAQSVGTADGDKMIKTQANGTLHPSMLPPGVGADMQSKTAGEVITAPAMVSINATGGMVNADASTPNAARPAVGFANESVALNATGNMFFEGISSGWTGLIPGAIYFLAPTPGAIQTAPVTVTGHILQKVGVAISATELSFEPGEVIIRG